MKIPFSPPDISEREIESVVETLRSGWITTGPKTKEFEKQIAEYVGTERAVCLNSSTAAMEMTLRLLGIGPGDEVIVPAYTYTASCSVICHVGATPVMVDIQPDHPEVDYEQVAEAITEKTKVIIPVDLAGIVCDYKTLYRALEQKKELFHSDMRNEIQRQFRTDHCNGGLFTWIWCCERWKAFWMLCRFYLLLFSCSKKFNYSRRRCSYLEKY